MVGNSILLLLVTIVIAVSPNIPKSVRLTTPKLIKDNKLGTPLFRDENIDDSLYSRQLYVIGKDAQVKLQKNRVLIIGLSGIGVEIIKNLALAGVSEIFLYDHNVTCSETDLSANYYVSETNITDGIQRIDAILPHLACLNPHCQLEPIYSKPNSQLQFLTKIIEKNDFDTVVVVDQDQEKELYLNNYIRDLNKKQKIIDERKFVFISCGACGVFGNIFCDFGDQFQVNDPTGLEPKVITVKNLKVTPTSLSETSSSVSSIGSLSEINYLFEIDCDEGSKHNLNVGDSVILENLVWRSKPHELTNSVLIDSLQCKVLSIKNPFTLTLLLNTEDKMSTDNIDKRQFVSGTMVRPKSDEKFKIHHKSLNSFLKRKKQSSSQKLANQKKNKLENFKTRFWSKVAWTKSNKKKHKNALIDNIPIIPCDWSKVGKHRSATVHVCWRVLLPWFYQKRMNHHPISLCDFQHKAHQYIEVVDDGVLRAFVHCLLSTDAVSSPSHANYYGLFGPVNSFIGAVTAQEVLKAATGVFSPISQFLYFDAMEILPKILRTSVKEQDGLSTHLKASTHLDRYPAQRVLLGEETCRQIRNQKWFVVGAGAIGCELLKNAALIGLGSLPSTSTPRERGGLIVTDMDKIEKSNLNRQFFFRGHHIGHYKSIVAGEAAKEINPLLQVTPLTLAVNDESAIRGGFDDKFWCGIDGVLSGLDNIDARLYVDRKCLQFKRPLIDAGTLGTKGNVQVLLTPLHPLLYSYFSTLQPKVVVPYLTETYGESSDPSDSDENIPICTIKSFPYQSEHTVQWARELFDEVFVKIPSCVLQLAQKVTQQPSLSMKALMNHNDEFKELFSDENYLTLIKSYLTIYSQNLNYFNNVNEDNDQRKGFNLLVQSCLNWAVAELLVPKFKLPIDRQRSEYGENAKDPENSNLYFWSGNRKRPKPFEIDQQNKEQVQLVKHGTRLLCRVLIGRDLTPQELDVIDDSISANEILRKQIEMLNIESNESKLSSPSSTLETVEQISKLITENNISQLTLMPLVFEKDNDLNGQISFIASASNLRGISYGIPPIENLQVKKITGRILPAIATTTAAVAALSCIELIKVIQSNMSSFMSSDSDSEPFILQHSMTNKKANTLLEKFRNSFLNLGVPLFAFSEPVRTKEFLVGSGEDVHSHPSRRRSFNSWDVFIVNPSNVVEPLSLHAVIQIIEEYSKSSVKSLSYENEIIFSDIVSSNDYDNNVLMSDIPAIQTMANKKDLAFVDLEVLLEDSQGGILDFPTIRCYLPL